MTNIQYMLRVAILSFVIFFFAGNAAKTGAQGAISPTLSITPGLKVLTVKPGEEVETSVTIANLGKDPVPLGVAMMNVKDINDNSAPEFTTAVTPRSANEWITVEPAELIVESGEKQDVTITVSPPKDSAPGGYSSVIVFQAKLPSYYFDLDASIRALPALSHTVLINVGAGDFPTADSVKIESFKTPRMVLSGPVPFVLELSNPTNFFIFTDGTLNVDPTFGGAQAVSRLKGSVLLPESTRRYVSAYTERLWPGVYKANFTIEQLDSNVASTARFMVLPWPFLLGFIGFLCAALFLTVRRRFKLAWKVLVGKRVS